MIAQPILLIEDEHALGTALAMLVRRMGHLPTLVASGKAGLTALERQRFAAVVLDIGLPDMSGLQVLERLRNAGSGIPVLVITAHATLEHAIKAQKTGATAYLTKPLDLRDFERSLDALLAPVMSAPTENPPARPSADPVTLIGAAPCLREAFIGIARACAGDVPALITGPSGSGKSLAAKVIHAHGTRSGEPLVFLTSSEIPSPDALGNAGAGTVVLEEITALSPTGQAQLAAWLGSPDPTRPRLLATTTADPLEAVNDGRLREDLYYALATLTVPLPPLRERSGDIPALTAFFTGLRADRAAPALTPPALAALQAYQWPGNVRELRHVLDYALTMCAGGPVFLSHLPHHIVAAAAPESGPAPGELEAVIGRWLDASLELPETTRPDYEKLMDQIEAVVLRHLMDRHDHKPTHLATSLGIHRATLRQKLRRAGIQRDDG